MKDFKDWIPAIIIGGVIIIGGGLFALYKHHQNNGSVAPLTSSTYNSSSAGSKAPTSNSSTTQQPTTQQSTPSCIPASQAASQEGQNGCVQFIGYAYTSGSGQMYLDQSTSAPYGFSVWIPAGTSGGSSLINQYSGQNIDVTGSITNYNGEPEIEVTSSSQIQLAH